MYDLKSFEDDTSEIKWEEYSGKMVIEEASLESLIMCLTSLSYFDSEFLTHFLRTFNSFSKPKVILEKIYRRYNHPPKETLTLQFFKNDLSRIRLLVVNFLKQWIERYYFTDFDEELKENLNFIIKEMKKTYKGAQYGLILERSLAKKELEKRKEIYEILFHEKQTKFSIDEFLLFESDNISQQLALISSESFFMIEKTEMLNQNYSKLSRNKNAIGITNCVHFFNQISLLVTSIIVNSKSISESSKKIEKFIDIAESSLKLNDFHSLFSILSGLNSSPVFRLKISWKNISVDSLKKFEFLQEIYSRDGNFKRIREMCSKAQSPKVPYIGICLTDLTFIEDGQPYYRKGIHFYKRILLSKVIEKVEQDQKIKYDFEIDPDIKNFILHFKPDSEDECYNQSISLEAKVQRKNK